MRNTGTDNFFRSAKESYLSLFSGSFTLVELLIVVLLIGTLAAAAMPFAAATMDQLRVSALARQIAADLRYAQSLAVQTGQRHKVSFAVTGQTPQAYQVWAWSGEAWQLATHPLTKKAWTTTLAADGPWAGVTLTGAAFGPNSEVVFDKYGAPDRGGTVAFAFGPLTRTIRVAPLSGRITVE